MSYKLNDRAVINVEIEFEHGEGAYVVGATWEDTGADLTEDECMSLEEAYQAELYQEAYEHRAARAYDDFKDRMKYGDD